MRFRTGTRETPNGTDGSNSERRATLFARFVRYVVVGIGVGVLAYAASRYLNSSERDAVPDIGELSSRAVEEAPREAQEILIDEPGREETETESPSETGATSSDEGDDAETIDDRMNAAFTEEPRSADEIAGRAESGVQDEPAEPGEMNVDEELADELVDDAEDERSADERDEE